MNRLLTVLLFATLALCASALAQNTVTPQSAQVQTAEDISGMYSFLQDGEFIQITVEDQTRVTGFISRYGELPSDKGAFLDQFIKKGALEGNRLSFRSEPVHGIWYEFRGTVERGAAKAQDEEGYWLLKGSLVRHMMDAAQKDSVSSREVTLKSFPQDAAPSRSRPD